MATLTGTTIASTYPMLLKTATSGGFTPALVAIEDGDGTTSSFSLATTSASFSGTLSVTGNFSIASTQFTVAALTGNTVISGTLNLAGNFAVNVNKFNVTASNGNTSVAGTFSSSGNGLFGSDLQVLGSLTVSGSFLPSTVNVSGTLNSTGNFSVDTNKFNVTASNGNTSVAGTLDSAGDFSVATNKFIVNSSNGNVTNTGSINGVSVGQGGGNIATNTSVGVNSLSANNTGSNNTANGVSALFSNQGGNSNTAVGVNSLFSNVSGGSNIALGVNAGDTIQTGDSNTIVGADADVDNGARNYCVVLGRGATSPASNGSLSIGGTGLNTMNGLVSGTANAASGNFLVIHLNGTQYKIALLNP